jgi:hypothetical protein
LSSALLYCEVRSNLRECGEIVLGVNTYLTLNTKGAGLGDGAFPSNSQSEIYDEIREEHAPDEHEDSNMAAVAIDNDLIFVTAENRLQNAFERTYPQSYLTRDEFISLVSNNN